MKRFAAAFVFACLLAGLIGSVAIAEDLAWQTHLKRGEFAAAKQNIADLPIDQRDAALARVAEVQRGLGDVAEASATYRSIGSAKAGLPTRPLAQTFEGSGERQGNGAGGSSFADFTSLIELITTTVNPETWEDMGGESTISEYPQGVFVNADGTLQSNQVALPSDAGSQVAAMLARKSFDDSDNLDWRLPATRRYVSLRRLKDAVIASELAGRNPNHEISHLAGLSQIEHIYLVGDDIVLAGPVNGLIKDRGWLRDRETGMATIRADVLAETIASVRRRVAFGCTIDPSTKGLQNAATVAAKVQSKQMSSTKAADAMSDAIGMQRIEVFGTNSNTPLALMMVEADRHMKELALGIHPMPESCNNYLDVIEKNIDKGLPNDLLLRLWFTAKPRAIRSNPSQTVFELSGTPIQLSGQNERAVADGSRGHVTVDFRSDQFVAGFNENWTQIRADYPIYAGLESVFQAASVAATSHRFAKTPEQKDLMEWWSILGERLNDGTAGWRTPTQVETIAVLHNFRNGRKRHHILVASGGVLLKAEATVSKSVTAYPALDNQPSSTRQQPAVIQRWWWDQSGKR